MATTKKATRAAPNGKVIKKPGSLGLLKKLGNVEMVPFMARHDELRPAPWNPPIRTQTRYLHSLRESMETYGFLQFLPIIVSSRDQVICDGHRRWTAAGQLGISLVPVILVDMPSEELWGILNGTNMPTTGAQVLQAVASGMKVRPPKWAELISQLEAVIGPEGFRELAGLNKSPHIVRLVMRVGRYLGLSDDLPFLRMTTFWLARHPKMPTLVSRAMRENISPGVIERAIRMDRPLATEIH